MPNWKKVIVSGSDAVLNSVTATAGLIVTGSARITGSLGVTGSFNQGLLSSATGLFAHAQGLAVTAVGDYSHAEGIYSLANGEYSHAEGKSTTATGLASHAEGSGSAAVGFYSHAEGYLSYAKGDASHAEGESTTTIGLASHAEGRYTTASGDYSHAEGYYTVAQGAYQHVQGAYNLSSSAQSAFIVGNGTGVGALRSNLIFASGSQVQITGSLIVSGSSTFTGSLQGTASYATMASQSGYTMQFVLATSASNLAASTTYIMGAPVRWQPTPATGSTRIYVPRPGRVRYAHLFIKTMATSSAGMSTFRLNKTDIYGITVSESIANTQFAARHYAATVVSTAISMSVVQGDWLEIAWVTPAWTALPKAVEANAIIYIENNI